MDTFTSITKHKLNDSAIEGAGSTFVAKGPFSVVAADVGGPGKFSISVSQHNGTALATGHITYPGKERTAYSAQRTAPLCGGCSGEPGTNASPSVDGNAGILIEPDQPLTFFKNFTAK
jgi:hypothetical protein